MIPYHVIALVLLAVGITLLVFGYNASESFTEGVREELTGRYSDSTMNYIIGGIASTVAGVGMLLWSATHKK
jgi:hypothetical protein